MPRKKAAPAESVPVEVNLTGEATAGPWPVSFGYQPYNEMPPPPPARNPHWGLIRVHSGQMVHYYTSEEGANAALAAMHADTDRKGYGYREELRVVPLGLPD